MKTGPYDPQINDISKYASVVSLGRQESDPSLELSKIEACLNNADTNRLDKIDEVVCSDLLRTRQTSEYLQANCKLNRNIAISYTAWLREIRFDITAFATEKDYTLQGSDAVRAGFLQAFIDDSLLETRQEIKARCDWLIELMDKNKHRNLLVISHTFFLKIFTTYLERPALFDTPQIITKYIEPQKRIMKFCEQLTLKYKK